MDKEEPNRDWNAEHREINEKGHQDLARLYIKDANKRKDDTFFDGQPINSPNRLAARAIIALVGDRTNADFLDLHQHSRSEITNIAVEIIGQVNAQQVADSIYERVQAVDDPKNKPTPPLNPHLSKLDQTMENMQYTFSELSMARRDDELREVMTAAVNWGNRDDLSPMERCQGLAHELYSEWGTDTVMTADGTTVPTSPGLNYARMYEHGFAEEIKARSMRAAKDLFGS
jgi:hypothetical protein